MLRATRLGCGIDAGTLNVGANGWARIRQEGTQSDENKWLTTWSVPLFKCGGGVGVDHVSHGFHSDGVQPITFII